MYENVVILSILCHQSTLSYLGNFDIWEATVEPSIVVVDMLAAGAATPATLNSE